MGREPVFEIGQQLKRRAVLLSIGQQKSQKSTGSEIIRVSQIQTLSELDGGGIESLPVGLGGVQARMGLEEKPRGHCHSNLEVGGVAWILIEQKPGIVLEILGGQYGGPAKGRIKRVIGDNGTGARLNRDGPEPRKK